MKPSAATLAARIEAEEASNAHAAAIKQNRPAKELACFTAVHEMATARLKMCEGADELAAASGRHATALAILTTV